MDWSTMGTIADWVQTATLMGTLVIVGRYTIETQRLRKTTEQQVTETQRQTEVQQRPFVIVTPEEDHRGALRRLKVQNIGTSAAINIRLVLDGEPTTLPVLPQGQSMAGPVIPLDQDTFSQHLRAGEGRLGEENIYDVSFPLKDASIADGFEFTIEYDNVAMHPYETVEKLWRRGFKIIRSGKRGYSSH